LKPFFHKKEHLRKPSASKAGELLSLNRNQLRIMTGLLRGHCHLKGDLFKLALVNSPECDRWKQVTEMASYVLCDPETLAAKRFRHLGRYFTKPIDFEDISISRTLHFVQGIGLLDA
jgi:hypothetical protein